MLFFIKELDTNCAPKKAKQDKPAPFTVWFS